MTAEIRTEALAARVRKLISEQLFVPLATIADDATLESLGADSLDIVELCLALEDEFAVEVTEADGEQLKTVRQVVDHVIGRLS